MGWNSAFKDMAYFKPIFMPIYATVVIGIALYCFYVFSDVYNSSSSFTSSLWSTLSGNQTSNYSQNTIGNKFVKPVWEVPSAGSKFPPLKTFKLSKKLVQQRVKENIIIVTYGNYAFMEFTVTWAKHLTDLGIENYLVGAMDSKLLEALYWKGVPVFDMGSRMNTMNHGWGSPEFHKMQREKAVLIDAILPFGFEVLICDTDMVWLKNPLPYLARYPDADILTSNDLLIPTVVDDSLDLWEKVGAAYNVGLFHWRPSNSSKKLAKEWKELILANEAIWDQQAFNDLVSRQLGPSVDEDSELAYAYDGNLKLGCLPVSIFCGGHAYFVQKMYQQLELEPYSVHTTHQFCGIEGKHHRLREAMLFYDSHDYYDESGGFLIFKPSIPKSLLIDGEHNIESHFALVNYQIKQIRTALAVASLLNRTLVMPPLWCRIDNFWLSRPRDLIGSVMRRPFICPLDFVFQVNIMVNEMPEDEFGPPIKIKEYSFFDNPSMPQKVKESWLNVNLCHEGSKGCEVSNTTTSQTGLLKFPKNSSEETYKTVFSAFKDVKVIQFSSMQDAFTGFADKSREEKFRKRVKAYVGAWCCLEDHTPSHIYYDIYWDEKPNWKPVPPQSQDEDHPP
ncbi:hypothetical protein ACH5RR_025489 [Cinchona calisaya]|uniref:Nucleotide-diphospho-sugar transferase domain-containing protein n=1 Tax=Cinchona calisaya TaxID=153742 RepID=A0ABD2YZS8_9GENT